MVIQQRVLVWLLVAVLAAAILAVPAQAQDDFDPSYSPIPGCAVYFDHYTLNALGYYVPTNRSWCGSDEIGWYTVDEWCLYYGICARDYASHE